MLTVPPNTWPASPRSLGRSKRLDRWWEKRHKSKLAQDSTEPLSIASSSPFLRPPTWSWGTVLLGNHLYQIHEGPQPIPNTIAIQSFHEQLLELKAMLRDRILQNTSVWIAESSKLCKSDYLLGEEIDLDRFWDHCFNIRPESIFYHRLHKAASSQALYTSKSPKSTVFDTTKWQWLKPETEVSVSRIT
jgi:uncharacterized protein YqcC (DUF446 family)